MRGVVVVVVAVYVHVLSGGGQIAERVRHRAVLG